MPLFWIETIGELWRQAKGAPAFHFSQQQVNLLFTNVIEQTIGYFPPGYKIDKIMSMTIAACDALDGKSDGVVSRTDLCKLHFDIDDIVGEPYLCDAIESNGSLRNHVAKSAATPAQSDVVMTQAAKLIKKYLNGPHDSDGRRIYLSSQCSSDLTNVYPQYREMEVDICLARIRVGGSFF